MNKLTTQEIEMFSKATEIQEMWQPELGDTFFFIVPNVEHIIYRIYHNNHGTLSPRKNIDMFWVPTQDQMQDIVFGKYYSVDDILVSVDIWWHALHREVMYFPETMRQFWLCLMMNDKFHKLWNGEDWEHDSIYD